MNKLSSRKIGGRNSEDFQGNGEFARNAKDTVLVFSSPRSATFNTTSAINRAAQAVMKGHSYTAQRTVDEIQAYFDRLIRDRIERDFQRDLNQVSEKTIAELRAALSDSNIFTVGEAATDYHNSTGSITCYGERIARRLYSRYFDLKGIRHQSLSLESATSFEDELATWTEGIAITGGYTAKDNLGSMRGYSDSKAALIAALKGGELVIAKQTALHNDDPNKNPDTKVIPAISFEEAEAVCGANGVVQSMVFDIIRKYGPGAAMLIVGADQTQTRIHRPFLTPAQCQLAI